LFVPELIRKKRDGGRLSQGEIEYLIEGYVKGDIPDYQMSAFLMAVYFRGMSYEETTALTLAMARSGEVVDLSAVDGVKVDKHSSGGIADTTNLGVDTSGCIGGDQGSENGRERAGIHRGNHR